MLIDQFLEQNLNVGFLENDHQQKTNLSSILEMPGTMHMFITKFFKGNPSLVILGTFNATSRVLRYHRDHQGKNRDVDHSPSIHI